MEKQRNVEDRNVEEGKRIEVEEKENDGNWRERSGEKRSNEEQCTRVRTRRKDDTMRGRNKKNSAI